MTISVVTRCYRDRRYGREKLWSQQTTRNGRDGRTLRGHTLDFIVRAARLGVAVALGETMLVQNLVWHDGGRSYLRLTRVTDANRPVAEREIL